MLVSFEATSLVSYKRECERRRKRPRPVLSTRDPRTRQSLRAGSRTGRPSRHEVLSHPPSPLQSMHAEEKITLHGSEPFVHNHTASTGAAMGRAISTVAVLGGRGDRYAAGDTTLTGRRRAAPRHTSFSRSTALNALKQVAARSDISVAELTLQMLRTRSVFDELSAEMRSGCSALAAAAAIAVFKFHRERLAAKRRITSADIQSILRPIYKPELRADPHSPLGIQPAAEVSPPSFQEWIDVDNAGPIRACAPEVGPRAKCAQWQLNHPEPGGVMCGARSNARRRRQNQLAGNPADTPPSAALMLAMQHTNTLPTLTQSKGDQYYLPEEQRYLGVREVARSTQIDGTPLVAALCNTAIIVPASAVAAIGGGVSGAVSRLLAKTVLEQGWIAAAPATYGALYAGVDTLYEGLCQGWGARPTYLFAAERRRVYGRVLREAHGLAQEQILPDAEADEVLDAPYVDCLTVTPPCAPHSKRHHDPSVEEQIRSMAGAERALRYVSVRRPLLVIIENVSEDMVVAGIDELVSRLPSHVWRTQSLDALTHGGVPVRRKRHFWIGIRIGEA